jgi:hypothetical protein
MHRIGAAIGDGVAGLFARHQTEVVEKFSLQVEIRRPQAHIGDVGDFDDGHCFLTLDDLELPPPHLATTISQAAGGGNLVASSQT